MNQKAQDLGMRDTRFLDADRPEPGQCFHRRRIWP